VIPAPKKVEEGSVEQVTALEEALEQERQRAARSHPGQRELPERERQDWPAQRREPAGQEPEQRVWLQSLLPARGPVSPRRERIEGAFALQGGGAGMAAAVLKLGRLPGVDRPALAVQMVTETGPFVLLDIGANMDSSGFNLYQFAHMGSLYAERVLGVPNPRVALLSIGEERGKGDQAVQQATQLLDDDAGLNFIGNVEGRDLVKHMADVAVCDAMVGNVTMKFFEGLVTFMGHLWEREFRRLPLGPIGYLFMRPGANRIRSTFDYERMGASPLLGVRGMVLITHGSAKRRMIEFAVEAGATAARAHIPDLIADAFRGQSRHPRAQGE